MDWAEMLERMYMRWAGAKGFKVEVLDRSRGAAATHSAAESERKEGGEPHNPIESSTELFRGPNLGATATVSSHFTPCCECLATLAHVCREVALLLAPVQLDRGSPPVKRLTSYRSAAQPYVWMKL